MIPKYPTEPFAEAVFHGRVIQRSDSLPPHWKLSPMRKTVAAFVTVLPSYLLARRCPAQLSKVLVDAQPPS